MYGEAFSSGFCMCYAGSSVRSYAKHCDAAAGNIFCLKGLKHRMSGSRTRSDIVSGKGCYTVISCRYFLNATALFRQVIKYCLSSLKRLRAALTKHLHGQHNIMGSVFRRSRNDVKYR